MRAAAALLTAPPGADALHALARAAGCDGPAVPLAADACDALGLPADLLEARVSAGTGALRALMLRVPRGVPARDRAACAAARLAARTPHLLWLLLAEDDAADERVIAAWSVERTPPRVAALSVTPARLVDSDAETLCALAAAAGPDDLLTHARWLEVLGRDALSRRFYRELEAGVGALAASLPAPVPRDDRRSLALHATSRLLFLAFLEAKGWLDGDRGFLARVHADAAARGDVHHRLLEPLFFGTLNTRVEARAPAARAFGRVPYLNGGLFTRAPLERRWRRERFGDDALAAIFDGVLARYRLTAREDRATWSDAAVDPEMLGRAFESLMASRERRASGAFYTPQRLVAELTDEALAALLVRGGVGEGDAERVLRAEPVNAEVATCVGRRLVSARLLDPACGSGAFLVHLLERVAGLLAACGDARDAGTIRREVLARSIFGVDASAMAVWLCELRLWLSTVIETEAADGGRVPTLPNLDHNVRVGDSLAGAGFAALVPGARPGGHTLASLRGRYARSTGRRKESLARALDRAERDAAVAALDREVESLVARRRELLIVRRQRDLFGARHAPAGRDVERASVRDRLRAARAERRALTEGGALPFSYPACFADAAAAGGFDLVVGNPPWVRLHNIPRRARRRLREAFTVFRAAAWERGAADAGAGRGFAAQVDLAALFVERAVDLLAPGGVLGFLLPAKLWRSLAGGGVRRLLAERCPPLFLEDLSASATAFDAAVYPSLLVAAREAPADELRCALRERDGTRRWRAERRTLALDESAGSPWLLVPPDVRRAFDRLARDAGTLATSVGGRPLLGVKTGCNAAFVVADDSVPADLLRPLVRGERLAEWRVAARERILWTHDARGAPLRSLPGDALRHLAPHRRALERRTDLRAGAPWWMLFRVESAQSDAARVVWADVGRSPRAACLAPGDRTVALNSCYVARLPTLDDAYALTALLNSPLLGAWLALVAEPARGGYHRYLGWTMALAPVPRDWPRARAILAPLGSRAAAGDPPSARALLDAAAAAYRVREVDVAPLVAWARR